jgi:hypothetical protein
MKAQTVYTLRVKAKATSNGTEGVEGQYQQPTLFKKRQVCLLENVWQTVMEFWSWLTECELNIQVFIENVYTFISGPYVPVAI